MLVYADYNPKEQEKIGQSIVELYVWLNCPTRFKYLLCPITEYFFIGEIPVIIMPRLPILKYHCTVKNRGRTKTRDIREFYFRAMGLDLGIYQRIKRDTDELVELFNLAPEEFTGRANIGLCEESILRYVDYGWLKEGREKVNPALVLKGGKL